jgi:hypothetical protein
MPTITPQPVLTVIGQTPGGSSPKKERSPGEIRRGGLTRQTENSEGPVLDRTSFFARPPVTPSVEEAVLKMLHKTGPGCLDDLVLKLPEFSWSQVFLAVDRMSRHGLLTLRRLKYSSYHVALSSRPTSSRPPLQTEGATI